MSFVKLNDHVEQLKQSLKTVGPLQECIVDKKTKQVLCGRHRKFADPQWPEKEVDVKDDLHRELIILHGNVQRRPSEEETKTRILRIANLLEQPPYLVPKDRVCAELSKLVPFDERYVRHLLPKEYKMESKAHKSESETPVLGAAVALDGITSKEALIQLNHEDAAISPHISAEPEQTVIPQKATDMVEFKVSYPYENCKCKECEHKSECGF